MATRLFPAKSIETALRVPRALKEQNGGNPWSPDEVATAINMAKKSPNFFYTTAASRQYGFTNGTRDAAEISLTDLGRQAVYPTSDTDHQEALVAAFMNIDLFRRVVEHYGGSKFPEQPFIGNTLEKEFGLPRPQHDEFLEVLTETAKFVGIGAEWSPGSPVKSLTTSVERPAQRTALATMAETVNGVCFVIMPFVERDDSHSAGFFTEVYNSLFVPAIRGAGFEPKTAARQGSDVIQSTIVSELLAADLVLADLTEHNPNVLFELGMRMAMDKPVALVRAKGTGAIFDVDNMLRVQDYNPNLWPTTVQEDVPRLTSHVEAAWRSRGSTKSYLQILNQAGS